MGGPGRVDRAVDQLDHLGIGGPRALLGRRLLVLANDVPVYVGRRDADVGPPDVEPDDEACLVAHYV